MIPAMVSATLLAMRALPAMAARVFRAMPPTMLTVVKIPSNRYGRTFFPVVQKFYQ